MAFSTYAGYARRKVKKYIPLYNPSRSTTYNRGFFFTLFQIPATKLPVGRHTWEMVTEICDTEESELAITSCKKDKFTCKTGKCIPLSYRCDIYQVRGKKRENNQV